MGRKCELNDDLLRQWIEQDKLSYAEAARRIGVSATTVKDWASIHAVRSPLAHPKDFRAIVALARYRHWTVLDATPKYRGPSVCYTCRCDCGEVRDVFMRQLRKSRSKGCKVCCVLHKGVGQMPLRFWSRITTGASDRALECSVTMEQAYELFQKQAGRCALTGWPIKFPDSVRNKQGASMPNCTASLDRIDSALGYTIDNIQWVHKDINWMKSDFSQERFIEACKAVAANQF